MAVVVIRVVVPHAINSTKPSGVFCSVRVDDRAEKESFGLWLRSSSKQTFTWTVVREAIEWFGTRQNGPCCSGSFGPAEHRVEEHVAGRVFWCQLLFGGGYNCYLLFSFHESIYLLGSQFYPLPRQFCSPHDHCSTISRPLSYWMSHEDRAGCSRPCLRPTEIQCPPRRLLFRGNVHLKEEQRLRRRK